MSLRRKLARLSDAGPGSRPEGSVEAGAPAGSVEEGSADEERRRRIARLRGLLDEMTARERRRPSEDRVAPAGEPGGAGGELPGAVRSTPHGDVHVVEQFLEPHHCHGHAPVRDALAVQPECVAQLALDVGLEGMDPRRMLLLDTETTGLAGGTGTIPFLVGLAWFEDESLCVRQLFLRRPGEEAPMLHALAERLAWASCIVTYNGKSFDWPLVRNRYVLNRVPLPEPPPHLDLLHCARRVYRRRFPRMKLVDLEVEVLGMQRDDDVPGAEIPALYLRWLQRADPTGLDRVIEHNAHDLIALAALLARVAQRYESVRASDDPRDHLSYAEVAARAGDHGRAWQFAVAAAEGGGDAECTARA
ncbi:MAG: ribonuclease H-like domain-containing protein, partial [Myxococcota bacterium]